MKSIDEMKERTLLGRLLELDAKAFAMQAVLDVLVAMHPDRNTITALLRHELNQLQEEAKNPALDEWERSKRRLAWQHLEQQCLPPPEAENPEHVSRRAIE